MDNEYIHILINSLFSSYDWQNLTKTFANFPNPDLTPSTLSFSYQTVIWACPCPSPQRPPQMHLVLSQTCEVDDSFVVQQRETLQFLSFLLFLPPLVQTDQSCLIYNRLEHQDPIVIIIMNLKSYLKLCKVVLYQQIGHLFYHNLFHEIVMAI